MPARKSPIKRARTGELDPAIARLVRAQMKETGTPAVAVGVLHKGRAEAKGFGVTSVEAPDPVDEETLFQIGSTTKTYTATAIMRLVDKKELDLDLPVRRYLRDLRLKDAEATRKVTLRHLLTHTGGWLGDYFSDTGRGADSLERILKELHKVPQLTPLGSTWHYNNAGFYIAGRVLEKVTGQSFETVIKELLLDPLGMTRSFFFADEAIGYRIAAGHITKSLTSKKQMIARPYALARSAGPAGGIIADVVDQLRWAEFSMGDGRAVGGERLLKRSTMRAMQTEQASAGSIASAVGISWLIDYVDGVKLVYHGGTTHGHTSAFLMVPEREFAVTVLTNSSRGMQVHGRIIKAALEHYLGLKRVPPQASTSNRANLDQYVGHYVDGLKTHALDVEVRGNRLRAQYAALSPESEELINLSAFKLAFFDTDRAVVEGGRLAGYQSEFLRDERERIRWIRMGGRILRKARRPTG